MDENEALSAAAARELQEETGLTGTVASESPKGPRCYDQPGSSDLSCVPSFLMMIQMCRWLRLGRSVTLAVTPGATLSPSPTWPSSRADHVAVRRRRESVFGYPLGVPICVTNEPSASGSETSRLLYPAVKAGDDAAEADWFALGDLPPLAFDHAMVIKETWRRVSVASTPDGTGHQAVERGSGQVLTGLKEGEVELVKAAHPFP